MIHHQVPPGIYLEFFSNISSTNYSGNSSKQFISIYQVKPPLFFSNFIRCFTSANIKAIIQTMSTQVSLGALLNVLRIPQENPTEYSNDNFSNNYLRNSSIKTSKTSSEVEEFFRDRLKSSLGIFQKCYQRLGDTLRISLRISPIISLTIPWSHPWINSLKKTLKKFMYFLKKL